MRKIKVLYGLEAAGGGALKHLVYLVSNLNKELFDVTVILSDSRSENIVTEIQKMKDSGVVVHLFPMCRNISPFKDLILILKLICIIRSNKYDIVHAHSSKAGGLFRLAGWFCGVKYIYYTPHCFYFQGKTGFRKIYFVLFERILAIFTNGLIVSESEKNEIIKNRVTGKAKIININNAIDFDEYRQNKEVVKTRTFYGIPQNAFVIGAIGRLVPQKDWETYIYVANEVLKKYPQSVFLIVGEGEQIHEIQKLICKFDLEDKVILTGYIKEIYKIYGIIDIYVSTSLWEGLPYVFLEAMKYKKPIVATNTGNTIIHEESGFVCPVRDYYSIAKNVIKLIEDKQLVIRMGERGKNLLTQKYSFQLFIQKHQELYLNSVIEV